MQLIIATIKLGQAGPEVANLQDALLALLEQREHEIFWPIEARDRPTPEELQKLTEGLKQERAQSPQSLFGEITARFVRDFQNQQGLSDKLGDKLGGVVEDTTAARLNEWLTKLGLLDIPEPDGFVVRGTVRSADGQPLSGAVVRAFDRDLRKEQPLGEATTDDRGQYIIRYGPSDFAAGDMSSATAPYLIVRAFKGDEQIGQDVTRSKPGRDEVIDFKVPTPVLSEWEVLCAGVIPLLKGQGEDDDQPLPPWEINDSDLNFIAEETGLEREKIRLWALAFVVGRDAAEVMQPAGVTSTHGPTTHAFLDPAGVGGLTTFAFCYGWFRQGLPTEWEALRLQRISTLRKALLDAIDQDIIPDKLREDIEGILARIPNPQIRELATVLEGVALPPEKMRAVLTQVDAVEAVSDEVLAQLVEQKTLTEPEAQSLGLGISLHRLTAGNQTIVSTMLDSQFPSVKTGKLQHARDLASLEPEDWERVLDKAGAPVPEGMARADYARRLAMEAVSAFPHAAFVHRATRVPEGIPDERVGWLRTVFDLNQKVDFLNLDYLPDSADLKEVQFGDLSKEARGLVLQDLKAHQRIYTVTNNAIPAREIMQAGFQSASAIALARASDFAEKAGLPETEAQAYHATAVELGNAAALRWFKLYEVARDKTTTPVRAIPSPAEFFKPLKGFTELINDQPWCACEHCQSVLSPAAYFVDLMYYIEENILKDSFKDRETHPLHLQVRRPDLWDLELTCKNTNEYVPYLDVVNEVLERYLWERLPHPVGATLNKHLYKHLADQEGSFQQPFTLPIERLEILLGHFGLSRYDVAKAMGSDRTIQARARLKISRKEYDLITMQRVSATGAPGPDDLRLLKQLFKIRRSSTLAVGEIKDLSSFTTKLKQKSDPVSAFLSSQLSSTTLQALTIHQGPVSNPEPLEAVLVMELNKIIKNQLLYDTQRFAGIGLRPETQELRAQNPQGEDLTRLNRLLLEDAYPVELSKMQIKDLISISSPDTVDTVLDPMEMQTFLHATGLAHEIVESVLESTFVNTDGSTNAKIDVVIGKRDSNDVQNNSELVKNVTLRRLDRVHRIVRLWRKLPWTVEELDYVLTQLAIPDQISRIDTGTPGTAGTLERILDLLDLNAEWSLPIDELMALSGVFPPEGLREPTSLFDRLFNQPPFLDRDGHWPPPPPPAPAIRFVHPAWRKKDNSQGVSDPNNNTLTRLLAGLQVEDKELIRLIESLAPAIGYQSATTTADESILLSKKSIGILYRHARLMRLLKSTVTDFVKLIELTPRIGTRPPADRYIRDLDDVTSVVEFAAWQRASGFSLDEITYVTGGARPEVMLDPAKLAGQFVARVKTEKSLEFADTVFTQIGLTDLQSRQIVLDNVSKTPLDNQAFEVLPDGTSYRFKAGFDPSETPLLKIDPSVDGKLVTNLLKKYHPIHVLDVALGSALNFSPEETKQLRELAHPLVIADVMAISLTMQGGKGIALLTELLTDMLRYSALFKIASEIVARVKAEKSLEFADTIFTQIGFTDLQSRQIVLDNVSKTPLDNQAFEILSDGVSYRLKAGFDPGTGLISINPPVSPPIDVNLIRGLLSKYDAVHIFNVALGNAVKRSPDEIEELRMLANPVLVDTLQISLEMQGLQGISHLHQVVTDTLRYCALFKSKVFDIKSLSFVRNNSAVFFPLIGSISTQVVRNVAAYVALAKSTDTGFTTAADPADIDALQTVIKGIVDTASEADLAKALRTDKTRIGALKPHLITLPSNPFDALGVLARCLVFTEQLGVSGETLSLMIKEESTAPATFDDLSRAAEDVFGAFRAKYPNEKTFQEKMEPFEDKLRTRKRDGLVDFVISKWSEPFADANKLYEYFLIDVLLEGCARTSRVVAAISSLQLFVHRVLMNLERSSDWMPNGDGSIPKSSVYARFNDPDKQAEWYWRENYRVWEANRKIFLYPENYIEPELRDDKTPLFKELEDTLLQQEISDSNVHDAYAKYLTGFDEVARLKIAGAYYERAVYDSSSDDVNIVLRDDVLHLFGVTQDSPPVYYYRTIEKTGSDVPRISAWRKLSLQIPVRKVSPLVFEGRLYVFWLETTTRPHSIFEEGKSLFEGYRHNVRIKYSTLRTDGAWTPPQSLSFSNGVATEESRIIHDPLPTDAAKEKLELDAQIADLKEKRLDLERAEGKASDEVRRTNTVVAARELEMKAGSTQSEDVDAVLLAAAASSAAVSAAAFYVFAGPPAQAAAFALAWWGVLAAAVGKSVPALQAAGVNMFDAPHMARRKYEVWLAKFMVRLAKDTLMTVTEALKRVREDLGRAGETKINFTVRWDKRRRDHTEPLDNYKPEGWEWDRVYPEVYSPPSAPEAMRIRLMLVPRNEPVPLYRAFQLLTSDDVDLTAGVLRQLPSTDQQYRDQQWRICNFHGNLRSIKSDSTTYGGQEYYRESFWLNHLSEAGSPIALAPVNSDVQVVNGEARSVIIESQGSLVWTREDFWAAVYHGKRLGTTLTASLAQEFGHNGASSLLAANFQDLLKEFPLTISPVAGESDPLMWNPFHPTNPFLTYFRETFFHIPFLVANHLNSQQKFAETQRWYHYIFNPTAADGIAWRYRELRDLENKSLREMLTDENALAAFREDPFNPHAIARTRLSAYQKSIVMKYIDNLLDWGDSLFSQFTMESVNEATMLYVMAQDILGPKPRVLGTCGEGNGFSETNKKTYKTIRPKLNEISDFLIELEAPPPLLGYDRPMLEGEAGRRVISSRQTSMQASTMSSGSQPASAPISIAGGGAGPSPTQPSVAGREFNQTGGNYWTNVGGTPLRELYDSRSGVGDVGRTVLGTESSKPPIPSPGNIDFINPKSDFAGGVIGVPEGGKIKPFDKVPPLDVKYGRRDYFDIEHPPGAVVPDRKRPLPTLNPVELVPPKDLVFCIPPNKDLLAYWGRVEDRLFKIRNCMDIAGVRRRLELFAPEIDPRLLVRMKAAGLTLEDVLNSTSGNLPPYRFTYLIEKARQYAGTLQSFGSQLLSAIEKRDGEELAQLRAVHEQNLLKMRSRMMQLEINAAEDAIEGLRRQKAAAEYRQDYFRSLSDVGLLASESKQQQHQREASNFRTAASVAQLIAAVLTVIPDVGAPTSMKFGGSQLGAAGRAAADGLNALAAFNEMSASMAGMEASNQRRDQEWKHQVQTAKRDILQIEKQITAAEIRREIAVHSLEVHEKTIEQSEEIFDYFGEKFSNLGRYTFLSSRLHGLYRQAFNSALSMARMTEQAYRAERTDDSMLLDGNYWDAGNAGLLAGERLLIDLQALERQYIEKNYRQLEIEQSFSLAQFAPDTLATLRLTGGCTFKIPEWFFDLTYPGQYRRRLKAARLTIPCVTGPYTNVGATLRLESSKIRLTVPPLQTSPPPTLLEPTPVPLRHTVVIASSKAQYDAGVFDFSFRDERYMPFEGAGAISEWQLSLPKTLRAFDYGTISDVIVHLSYTAEFNEDLKAVREEGAQNLIALLTTQPMIRLFSLRHEFPDVFHRLIASPRDTEIDFTIEPRHFPFFLMGRPLKARSAKLRVISSLSSLLDTTNPAVMPSPRTTLALGQKESPATRVFRDVRAPDKPVDQVNGRGMREFDFGDVLQSLTAPSGIAATLNGDYLIKLTAAGPLAPDSPGISGGPIDPAKLHDIILELGYSLVAEASSAGEQLAKE